MKNIKTLLFPVLVIFCAAFISTSCNQLKTEETEPENVCILTPKQIPEVRGFRLGSSYDEIKKRFPTICPIPVENRTVVLYPEKATENNAIRKPTDCAFSLNLDTHPELEDIFAVRLTFDNNEQLSNLEIGYEKTFDKNFNYTFQKKTKETLGLSQFTNWESVSNVLAENRDEFRLDAQRLICNKVEILVGTQDYKKETPSYSFPVLRISNSDMVAKTKAQTEQDKKSAEEKKKAEEKEKRDAFKP